MEEKEFAEIMAHMDVAETLIRANKAREFIENGQTEDAIAYAMASGFRMGWEAHKNKEGK